MLGSSADLQPPPHDENVPRQQEAGHSQWRHQWGSRAPPKAAARVDHALAPPLPAAAPPPTAPPPTGFSGLSSKFTPRSRRQRLTSTNMRLPFQPLASPPRIAPVRFGDVTEPPFQPPFQRSLRSPLAMISPVEGGARPRFQTRSTQTTGAFAPCDILFCPPPRRATYNKSCTRSILKLLALILILPVIVGVVMAMGAEQADAKGSVEMRNAPKRASCGRPRAARSWRSVPRSVQLELPMPECRWDWRRFNCADTSEQCRFSLQRLVVPHRKACEYEPFF
jgi:hypothetical protein